MTAAYNLSDIDQKELVFGHPHKVGSGYVISVKLLKDGVNVPLLIRGSNCWNYCFGLKEWKNKDEKKPSNYTTGIVVRSSTGGAGFPTEEQETWVHDYKEKIVVACAHAIVQMKSDVKKPNLTLTSDLLTGSSFSRLSETKNGDLLLNLKMRQYSEAPGGVVLTEFVDKKTMKDIAPNAMIGRKCSVIFEMLIDSIFVGSTITIQTKLDRACVSEKKAQSFIELLWFFIQK